MEFAPILRALSRNKTGAVLIALQIALTMAIVTNAGFIIRQRDESITRPTGLDEANTFFVVTNAFRTGLDYRKLWRDDLDALKQLPGVIAVTPIQSVPVSGGGWGEDVYRGPGLSTSEAVSFGNFITNEDGLDAFGVDLVSGRNFTSEEVIWRSPKSTVAPRVILVSQALADKLFPGEDAVGKLVWDEPGSESPIEIIGVYGHMMNAWVDNDNVNASAIMPMISFDSDMRFFVRASPGMRDEAMKSVETLLAQNHDRLVRLSRTFEEQIRRTYSADIAMVKLLSGVIVVLSLVTGLGIVGLAWFSVSQRHKQIGTRRALGATQADIMRYFMIENWLVTNMGLVLGVAGALTLNWFLDTEYQTGRIPLYYLPLGVVLLWLLGQAAVLIPARRAARIPPALATRSV